MWAQNAVARGSPLNDGCRCISLPNPQSEIRNPQFGAVVGGSAKRVPNLP